MIKTNNKSIDFSGSNNYCDTKDFNIDIPASYTFTITGYGRYKRDNTPIKYWNLTAKLNLALSIWKG